MVDRMKWAILGTGKIANRFAAALNNIPDHAELLAVGSREAASGTAFSEKYHIPRVYTGYQAVAGDPDVDVVYIGTPGVYHLRDVSMCLEAGKHVLCEKAFTINYGQAKELVDLARKKDLFLMEAMWTRFFPIHIKIRELVKQDVIGKMTAMVVNFATTTPFDPKNRFFDMHLGAGVLLDIGSYGVSWAFSLLGKPRQVTGLAYIGPSGADYSSAALLKYPQGQLVSIMCSQVSYDYKEAVIIGSHGRIEVHDPWYKPTSMTVYVEGKEPETIEFPLGKFNGYEYEALAVMECIQAHKTECDIMPLDETLDIMLVLDDLRSQLGIKYPFE
jgi:predicted dehydrogenase